MTFPTAIHDRSKIDVVFIHLSKAFGFSHKLFDVLFV